MKGQKTGGRTKGTPNRATADLKAAAQLHTTAMLAVLASIAKNPKSSDAARVQAAKAVLEFGHGKAPQALTDADGGLLVPKTIIHKHVTATE